MSQTLSDIDAKGISNNIKTSLSNINENFDPVRWGKLITSLEKNLDTLEKLINSSDNLMKKASELVDGAGTEISNLNRHLIVVGQNLEKTTGNLDNMLEQISDHPAQLLFGDPPPRRVFGNSDE